MIIIIMMITIIIIVTILIIFGLYVYDIFLYMYIKCIDRDDLKISLLGETNGFGMKGAVSLVWNIDNNFKKTINILFV